MKTTIIIALLFILMPYLNIAQDACTAYLPAEGSKLTYANFDKKGKQTSTTTTSVISVTTKDGATYFRVHQLISTGKKKDDMENDFEYRCEGNNFYIDMNSVLNQEQLKGFDDASIKVKTNSMIIPGNLEPGMELEDGLIEMSVYMSPMTTEITARAFYREVVAIEEITTPAGTFNAYKIKGYVESKIAFMRFAFKTMEWYVQDIGVIRSESYDKKDNLMGYTELQSVEN